MSTIMQIWENNAYFNDPPVLSLPCLIQMFNISAGLVNFNNKISVVDDEIYNIFEIYVK